jgi:hypothetical protein
MTVAELVVPEPISEEKILSLVARGIDHNIASIDLEMVKMKMADPEEGSGWERDQIEDAEVEYKRYLTLCSRYPHPHYSIVPNGIMDEMWHYHILDTRAYQTDCNRVFGHYLHHFPYFGLRGGEDAQNLKSAFEITKELYEDAFGESLIRDEASKCDRNCVSRCQRACKTD